MEMFLSMVLLQAPQLALVWLALVGFAGLASGALVTLPRRTRFDEAAQRVRRAAMPTPSEWATEWREILRYAEEVGVAAERAGATARRRRAEWMAAQRAAEEARTEYEAAEAEVRRLAQAAAFPLPDAPRTPAEYAFRERYLHRIALRAYRRGHLSVEQFVAVLAGAHGWDPRRHPIEQELILARVVRDNLRLRYRVAAERERLAWYEADRAAAAALSLRDEAARAADHAHWVRYRIAHSASARRAALKRLRATESRIRLQARPLPGPVAIGLAGAGSGGPAQAVAVLPRQRSAPRHVARRAPEVQPA
ncbi:MAG TPA: hypothetical protein VIL44_05405 [Micromonospora sp.]